MADYTTETVTTTVHRWIVPAAQPWGAAGGEIDKAWDAARRAYWASKGVPDGGPLPDDALRFHATDDAIVISFTTEGAR
ncbi:hypothetical protein ACFWEB_17210 [Streptomyces parvus]|uniref:hypothetical protein n=1 Tax=Streptomyces parvus TaxID=66428 RepID=UPI003655CBF9